MIDKVRARLLRLSEKFAHWIKKKYILSGWIAHHGMQRNGTNFLLLSLKKLNIDVINKLDSARNEPQHKHFRWYSEKSKIPNFIRNQYNNTITVETVSELNQICGFPKDTRHIVIKKRQDAALVSLANWGLHCNWFASKEEALGNIDELLQDYQKYYSFWQNLSELEPSKVVVIDFEDVISDSNKLLSALRTLGFLNIPSTVNLEFDYVPQSPKTRNNPITMSDYSSVIRSNKYNS